MIDEIAGASTVGRVTRAEQRAATRTAIVRATAECLVEEGYGALTTRRVAERAGVAQSTLMHHFETREALLTEAITQLALRLSEEALDSIDLEALHRPEHRDAVFDQAWRTFTSPQALAAAQLWVAAWSEPELAAASARAREADQRDPRLDRRPRCSPSTPAIRGFRRCSTPRVSLIRGSRDGDPDLRP